jgi:hypothetical protein
MDLKRHVCYLISYSKKPKNLWRKKRWNSAERRTMIKTEEDFNNISRRNQWFIWQVSLAISKVISKYNYTVIKIWTFGKIPEVFKLVSPTLAKKKTMIFYRKWNEISYLRFKKRKSNSEPPLKILNFRILSKSRWSSTWIKNACQHVFIQFRILMFYPKKKLSKNKKNRLINVFYIWIR